jgi:CDP-ribitol ribitolphosphotransferase
MTPGPVFNTTAEVAEWTLSAKEGYDYQELEDFRNKFMSSCDGSATERILNDVLGDVR